MKKKYLVTVNGDRYIWQRIDDNSDITLKEPSFLEVVKKLPKIFKHMRTDRHHAMYAISGYTILLIVFSIYEIEDVTIIAALIAFLFSLLIGPFNGLVREMNTELKVCLGIYPFCIWFYNIGYSYIVKIRPLNRGNIGNTLTAVSLGITMSYELYKMLAKLSRSV